MRFVRDNGLTIALMLLFIGSFFGHWLAGLQVQNEELIRHGQQPIGAIAFLNDPLFLSTVFENWESEFLQMAFYVVLTGVLFQRGSAESADPDATPREGDTIARSTRPNVPAALHRGELTRWIYGHSLGITLFGLFVASFVLHWVFSAREAASEAAAHGTASPALFEYLFSSQLWFESFQNWQSEFLSTAAIVVLSIFLRQQGSPESKAVAASHGETGA